MQEGDYGDFGEPDAVGNGRDRSLRYIVIFIVACPYDILILSIPGRCCMRPTVIAGLLILQTILSFFAWSNPLLPYSNWFSALLIFLVPVPTFLIGFAYAKTKSKQLFLFVGLSGAATFMPPSFLLMTIEHLMLFGTLLLLLTGGIVFVLYGVCFTPFYRYVYTRFRWASILILPAMITSGEFLRFVFAQYIWVIPEPSRMFAHPLVGILPLIQMSSFTGSVGPEFLVCFVATAIALVLWESVLRNPQLRSALKIGTTWQPLTGIPLKRAWQTGLGIGGLLLLLTVLGNIDAALVTKKQEQSQRFLRPALMQANYDPSVLRRWDRSTALQVSMLYRKMILTAVEKKADLIVFAENAFPMALPRNKRLWDDMRAIFCEVQLPAIIGAITVVDPKHSVSMWYHVNAEGKVSGYYGKRALVPFGEYLPMRGLVDKVLAVINVLFEKSYEFLKITAVSADKYDLVRGKRHGVFRVEPDEIKIFLSVCNELKYMKFVRDDVRKGGEIGFSLGASNWFKSPVYFTKQLENCIFRAIESRRWFAHLSSLGGSAHVDATGKVRQRSVYNKRSVMVESIPVLQGRSFYVRFGDIFGWLCLLFSFFTIGWVVWEWIKLRYAGSTA
jgi:apolipoprotein N-acyltransferase